MRLTTYTDCSLWVLMYLGLQDDRLATNHCDPSKTDAIASTHLMKFPHTPGKLGYRDTVRGRVGGMMLAGDSKEINLGQPVRRMEPDFAVVECQAPRHSGECVIAPCCRLQVIMDKAVQSFFRPP